MALPAWNILRGKTAAITGATTGIGRAIALEYIRQGCNVAINHLGLAKDEHLRHSLLQDVESLRKQGASAGEVLDIAGDVADPKTSTALIDEAVKRWGKLDAFVANAGVFRQAELFEYTTPSPTVRDATSL